MLVASVIVHSLVRQLQRFRVGPATAHSEGRDATAVAMRRMSATAQLPAGTCLFQQVT